MPKSEDFDYYYYYYGKSKGGFPVASLINSNSESERKGYCSNPNCIDCIEMMRTCNPV